MTNFQTLIIEVAEIYKEAKQIEATKAERTAADADTKERQNASLQNESVKSKYGSLDPAILQVCAMWEQVRGCVWR